MTVRRMQYNKIIRFEQLNSKLEEEDEKARQAGLQHRPPPPLHRVAPQNCQNIKIGHC